MQRLPTLARRNANSVRRRRKARAPDARRREPGDQEDLDGRPFVGPAGRLLDKALALAGIDRADAYVTNAVKHFKWEPRGKRRLHKTPTPNEIGACLPWLELEIELVKPLVLVCLGATASRALLGRSFRVTQERGRPVPSGLAPIVTATIHPSALLRLRDEISREVETHRFIGDLEFVRNALAEQRAAPRDTRCISSEHGWRPIAETRVDLCNDGARASDRAENRHAISPSGDRLRRHARHRRRARPPTVAALRKLLAHGAQARARHRPRAGRPAAGLPATSTSSSSSSPRTARCSIGRPTRRKRCSPSRRRPSSWRRSSDAASRRCRSAT